MYNRQRCWRREISPVAGYGSALLTVLVLLAPAILLLLGPGSSTVWAANPPPPERDPTIGTTLYHQIIAIQGDDPASEEVESDDVISFVDRTQWSIYGGNSEVYVDVPEGARNVVIDNVEPFDHQGLTLYQPGEYSRYLNPNSSHDNVLVDDGKWEGHYTWRFPDGADRNTTAPIAFTTDADFEDLDPEITTSEDWTIEDGTLALAPGVMDAVYTSKRYIAGNEIVSIIGSYSTSGESENLTVQVTEDNGTTWVELDRHGDTPMTGQGHLFRWRVLMEQNVSLNNTPVLERLDLSITYSTLNTVLWLETQYTLEVPRDALEFDLRFLSDYEGSTLVFIGYFDSDYDVTVKGMEITTGTTDVYSGRTAYRHMTGAFESTVTFKVESPDEVDDPSSFLLIVGLPMIIIVVVIIVFIVKSRRAETTGSASQDEVHDASVEEPDEADSEAEGAEGDVDGLELEKERLLAEISRIDDEFTDGNMDQEEHARLRAEYKAQAVEVMKRLNAGGR